MTRRSHSKTVVFSHSFELKDVDRILPSLAASVGGLTSHSLAFARHLIVDFQE
jgi:hypothetical protein